MTEGSRKTKKLVALSVLICFFILAAVLFLLFRGPAEGTVSNPPTSAQATPPVGRTIVTGKTVSFSYPSNFTPVGQGKPSGNDIETFVYVKKPSPFWFLSVSVSSLPSGKLADDGSYNMRSLNPERYKKSYLTTGGQDTAVFFDSSEGYAKTAYLARGDKLFSLSLTAGSAADSSMLDGIFAGVLQSLKWLN